MSVPPQWWAFRSRTMLRPSNYFSHIDDPPQCIEGQSVLVVTKVYDVVLGVLFALLPSVTIAYIALFQDPTRTLVSHLFHDVAIFIACLTSGFIAYVTWKSYRYSGEVLLRWLAMGFLGFTLTYMMHGLFTHQSEHHMVLFLIYGPVSRVVLGACVLIGLLHYGRPQHQRPVIERKGFWLKGIVLWLLLDVILALLATSPMLDPSPIRLFAGWADILGAPEGRIQVTRFALEGCAIAFNLASIALILARARHAPLMLLLAIGQAYFVQASIAFLLGSVWNHQWWLAHAVFAAGFLMMSWGVVQVFQTTGAFARVFSLNDLMRQLVAEKRTTQSALEQLRKANELLEKQATTDSLTGIANRKQILRWVETERERVLSTGSPLSVLLLDVDRFKQINDRLGHSGGDRALMAVVQAIASVLRPADRLGRLGGEEFLILLPEAPAGHALQVAEQVRAAIEARPVMVEDELNAITASIGVATLPADGTTTDAVVAVADKRMYEAKRAGRNQVVGPASAASSANAVRRA